MPTFDLSSHPVFVENACAWALVPGQTSNQLVMVYPDEETGRARVSCFTDAGMNRMPAEEYGFDHSLLTDIDRITDAELVSRLQVSPVSRDSQWHPGPWGETVAADLGIKFKKKASHASSE